MSKVAGGNPWTVPPRRPRRTGLVVATLVIIIGACLAAITGGRTIAWWRAGEPAATHHWIIRDPPASATGPEAQARNDRLTAPSGFEAIPVKKVETLKVTRAGTIERGARP